MKKSLLKNYYSQKGKSMQEIARILGCSLHKVQYWMKKYNIQTRSISDAVYKKYHPRGDPFRYIPPRTKSDERLFGMGIGLYWGEGTKADHNSVRLGNTDPRLLKTFLRFMIRFFSVKQRDFRFSLQIFSDTPPHRALAFWRKELHLQKGQFYRVTVTKSGSLGTYRKKSPHGVLTLYYHNRKLRKLLGTFLPP